MIAQLETTQTTEVNQSNLLGGNIDPRRLLKKYNGQIKTIERQHLFLAVEMKRKEFLEQAAALREKLETTEFPAGGNIIIVTCLPHNGSLVKKMKRVPCRHRDNRCDCRLGELQQKIRLPRTLHALIGVNDGCLTRLPDGEERDTYYVALQQMVTPFKPLTVWSCLDMASLFPDLLSQQGFVCGCSVIRNTATALWVQNGVLTFGSTEGRSFHTARNNRWGVPSYQTMVAI